MILHNYTIILVWCKTFNLHVTSNAEQSLVQIIVLFISSKYKGQQVTWLNYKYK